MKPRFLSFHVNRGAGSIGLLLLVAAMMACLPTTAPAKPKEKPTPTPAPSPTATPTPTPTATPMPTASNTATAANYSGDQQMRYQNMAKEAFITLRTAKAQPFIDAYAAFDTAGGVSAKGLNTKEDITARRDLLAKTIAANDEYLAFVKDEEYIYRVELNKTSLVQGDVDSMVKQFLERTNVGLTIKLRETETAALKAGDDILAFLDKRIGSWTVSDTGSLKFKKPSDLGPMTTLSKKYGGLVTELQAYQKQIQAMASPSPSPGASASPAAVPGAAVPAGSPGGAAAVPGPVPTVSATPAPAPSASASATATPAASVKK